MDDAVAQFTAITGAPAAEAAFFLQSTGGSVEEAIEMYFDQREGRPNLEPSPAAAAAPAAKPPAEKGRAPATAKPGKPAPKAPGKMRTLADFQTNDEESDEDDGKGATTYAGGKSSGLAIQQPGQPKKSNEDITKDILSKARERGAQEFEDWQREKGSSFQGAGYRLGTLDTPVGQHKPLKETVKKERHFTINFWSDGFSVDDGELRGLNEPNSKAFLDAVNKGDIPAEIQRQLMAETDPTEGPPKVFVHLDQKNKPYEPPPKSFKTFTGAGRSLADQATSAPAPAAANSLASRPPHQVDDSQPTTSLQIRLADGTRLQCRFNLYHTIDDIRGFINRSRPQTRPYDIITTMPRQVFSDGTQTLQAAGLQNAAVVQHLL